MNKTVLIADDDRNIVELLKRGFIGRGYRVITAYDGRTALDLIRLNAPDLVVLDIMMPDIDGLTLGVEARNNESFCGMPVIIITGETQLKTQIIKSGRIKINAWFNKPFNIEGLLNKADEIIMSRKHRKDYRPR